MSFLGIKLEGKFWKSRSFIAGTILINCLSACLLSVSFATNYWFSADCNNVETERNGTGTANFGLFSGYSFFDIISQSSSNYMIVCLEGECMYSSNDTKQGRQDSLNGVLNSGSVSTTKYRTMTLIAQSSNIDEEVVRMERYSRQNSEKEILDQQLDKDVIDYIRSQDSAQKALNREISENNPVTLRKRFQSHGFDRRNKRSFGISDRKFAESSTDLLSAQRDSEVNDVVPELMNEGLWIVTIIGLSGGLLFAVIGAIFAIINTATTPIEAITGIPGLFAWNITAGFSEHVFSNLLESILSLYHNQVDLFEELGHERCANSPDRQVYLTTAPSTCCKNKNKYYI